MTYTTTQQEIRTAMMIGQTALVYDPAAHYQVTISDIEYRRDGDVSWLARIYQPQGPGPFLAILDVHGGAWTVGSRTQNQLVDTALAESGIVVVALDFRLAPVPYPAQVQDVNYGTRWLKTHAVEFKASPEFLGGLGTSSGGHTVMLSALRPRDPRYAAIPLPDASDNDASLTYVLSLWGVLDPYARYLYAKKEVLQHLIHGSELYFGSVEAMQEGNPVLILERGEKVELPPVLIVQGTHDANVPKEIPERFYTAYNNVGGAIELEWFPGSRHGFARRPGPDTVRALQVMKDFIARQVKVPVARCLTITSLETL
jgi:acetyl esterase/lipase